MLLLKAGIVIFVITAAIFRALLPRSGQRHRWVEAEWEPYISVALCSGVALAFTMTLSRLLNMLGSS